jgi:Icc protein
MTDDITSSDKPIVLAQITDSHLFADTNGLHHGHNVMKNLSKVLHNIQKSPEIDLVIFTGDLTQDHTEQSYQNFVDCVDNSGIELPFYYLAGNHDEPEILDKYLNALPFYSSNSVDYVHWQIQLLESKSLTPAGYVSKQSLVALEKTINVNQHQLIMMHHHPIDVGYFIDKHGLQNKGDFWRAMNVYDNIKVIACGHVHSEREFKKQLSNNQEAVTVYTCPATSIQFDPDFDGVAALKKGPGYRVFYLYPDGKFHSNVVYL